MTPASNNHRLHESKAFREALFRSELHRAYAVIGVLLILAGPTAFMASSAPVVDSLKVVGLSAAVALLAVQAATVAAIRWAGRHDRLLPPWFNALGVVIECSIPTGAILCHIGFAILSPHAALSAPPVLAYGILIGLTTLRLQPWLCLLAGFASASGYLLAVAVVHARVGFEAISTGIPAAAYAMTPILIVTTGLAAAWVTKEIRAHVVAALGELETRQRMERLQQDLEVARTIQQSLLPRSAPQVRGFDIAGWNRPADETGGDYYDWQRVAPGRWIITLADVCGHGIGPALVTAACRAYVRASAVHHADLATLATRVNDLLAADLPEGRFVTMANLLIDEENGEVALLSAGHGPIVLYVGATGEVRDILPGDLPLAVASSVAYGPAQTLVLAPGDMIALATDGFVEWSRSVDPAQRDDFGLERLRESLRRHASMRAAELIDAVARDVETFAGGVSQQDDLTIVVVRRV